MKIDTKEIRLSPKKLISILLMEYGIGMIAVSLIVAFLLGVSAFIFDFRFFIVALIWIFIIIPMGMFLLFLIYGMLPTTAYNTLPHKIHFEEDALEIEFLGNDNEDDQQGAIKSQRLEYNYVDRISIGPSYLIVFFNAPRKGWLWMPVASFYSPEDFKSVTETLKPYCKEQKIVEIEYENPKRQ